MCLELARLILTLAGIYIYEVFDVGGFSQLLEFFLSKNDF